jgi:hypothetical protein
MYAQVQRNYNWWKLRLFSYVLTSLLVSDLEDCKPCFCCVECTRLAEVTFGNEKAVHNRIKQTNTMRDFSPLPRSSWELRWSGLYSYAAGGGNCLLEERESQLLLPLLLLLLLLLLNFITTETYSGNMYLFYFRWRIVLGITCLRKFGTWFGK